MKIAIDCRMYGAQFTGIGRYCFELIQNLAKLNTHQNEYYLLFNPQEFEKFKTPAKNFHKIKVDANHYSLKEQTTFLKALNKLNPDLTHFTHFNAPIFYKKPFIVTIHDLTLHFYPGKKMTGKLQRLAYHTVLKSAVNKAKKIIAVSNNTKKDLQDFLNVPAEKIKVIYNGVSENFFKKISPQASTEILKKYKISKPYLLYTGVWRSHKNLAKLIHAFAILKHTYGFNGQLVITGKHDPIYAAEIFTAAVKNKIISEIIFTGMVDEENLPALYQNANAYIFPSLYEGFGIPALEAMASGIVPIVSNTSCLPEICKDSAQYFNPTNAEDMAKKINQVLVDPEFKNKLIQNGQLRIKDFSWAKMADQTLQIYNNI